jgi:hypothetical protein
LLQDKQQQHQKQHLQRQLRAKLSQESSQQMKRIRSRWYAALAALLLAVIVAVLLAFTPVGWPVLPHRHYSWKLTQQPGKPAMVSRYHAQSSSLDERVCCEPSASQLSTSDVPLQLQQLCVAPSCLCTTAGCAQSEHLNHLSC